jgi:signal transduction histidine kinase/DNA-binding response OmpR family regulator
MKNTSESWVNGTKTEDSSIKVFIKIYILILLTFIAIGPRVFASDWVSSSDFYASIEISSAFIAIIAAIACLMYYLGLKSKYFLIIGLGFFIAGSEDFINGLFSFKRLVESSGVDFSRFGPGTFAGGKSMLAILIIAAGLLEFRKKAVDSAKSEAIIFSTISIGLGGGMALLPFIIPLPKLIYPEKFISRPLDFVSAILFLVAFFLIMRRYLIKRDIFSGMLLACILLNFGGLLYMSFSKQFFDVFFDVAHWANILSYCMPVMGITIESFHEMRRSSREVIERKRAEEQLQKRHEDLLQLNKDLAKQKGDLSLMNAVLENARKESERQNWHKTGQAELNDRMRGEQDITTLSQHIISYLTKYLGAQVGAIYLADKNDLLKLAGSYAYTVQKNLPTQFALGEGIVGQAALEKESILLANVPDDYIKINSGLGVAVPHNILVTPFLFDGRVQGIIELGSFDELTDYKLEFLKLVGENIAIAIDSAQSRSRMKDLLEATQLQAEELERRQGELKQANEELEKQTKALKESEARLQAQQEELLQTNEELEEQTQTLEWQKEDIQKKNAELENAHEVIEEKAKELETANKYKSEFMANVSHELRTPLNSILLLSKLVSENKEGNLTDKQIEFAQTIHSSGSDLLSLINEILDISKVEAGKMELHIEDMNIREFAGNMERNFQHIAQEKGLYLKTELEGLLPVHIRSDQQKMEQIVKNFLSNALKFTSTGGITLKIGRPSDHIDLSRSGLDLQRAIVFSVTDTGIGIPKDEHNLIFEAFQQVNGTTIRRYGGTGLGLYISRELAKLLGGEIQVQSSESEGSTFTLYLPETLAEADIRVASKKDPDGRDGSMNLEGPVESKPGRQKDSKKSEPAAIRTDLDSIRDDRRGLSPGDKSILIIENDYKFAKILCDLSRENGFKVLVAGDGETGLHFADFYKPSAIILDIGLPGMDGLAVMSRLKENLETRHIPVHFISAYDESHYARKMGAIGYLLKPGSMEALEEVFEKIRRITSKSEKNLLIVEGDVIQRKAIIELIGNGDVAITIVDTGQEAYEQLKSGRFDCMILDPGLSDMSGTELLAKIKSDEEILHIPTIIYTGRKLTKEEESFLNEYAESIITIGPKSPERLLDKTTLFLHRDEAMLPEEQQRMLREVNNRESILKDKKIILIDDDMRNVFALTNILEEIGIEVLVGKNGKEGLECLNSNPDVNLVLMDIMMPEMDGYEAMRELRKQERFRNLPIIALTAKAMRGDRNKCIEAGASDYLAKPLNSEKLLSMLKTWLYR